MMTVKMKDYKQRITPHTPKKNQEKRLIKKIWKFQVNYLDVNQRKLYFCFKSYT